MLLRDIFPKLTHNNFLDRTHKNVSDVSFKWILRDRFTVFEVIILIYDLCRVGVFFPEFQPQQFCLSLLTCILHSFKNILSLDHVSAWTPFPPSLISCIPINTNRFTQKCDCFLNHSVSFLLLSIL